MSINLNNLLEQRGEAHKEKFPPTTTNFSEQQHKEKIPSTTENSYNLSNNHDDSNIDQKPKKEIKFTPDYEAGEPIFWRVFGELSNDYNELVSYDKLQERLISTGKFYAGDAVLMIEHMEKTGKIEQTEQQYHMYRKKIQKLD